MTPLQIIITCWLIGTAASFIMLLKMSEDSETEKKVINGNKDFSPNTMRKILYVVLFLQSFLMWPYNLGKIGFEYIRMQLVQWLIVFAVWLYGGYNKNSRIATTYQILKILYNKP